MTGERFQGVPHQLALGVGGILVGVGLALSGDAGSAVSPTAVLMLLSVVTGIAKSGST